MKSSDSKTPPGKGRAGETARDRLHRKLDDAAEKAERLTEAMGRLQDAYDHVDQAMLQWQREMPEVEIRGADVLNRARRIVLESRPAIEANFRRHGLDTGEFDVLASLRRSGAPFELRPTELYRTLMISSGGLTARLDRLEEQGLIRRRPAGDDARSWIVELTQAGKKKIEAAFRADMEIENKMVEGLSEKERTDLIRLLRKLTQAMKGAMG